MGFVENSWKVQRGIEDRVRGIGHGKYGRVLRMARKPSKEEYIRTCQIVGVGLGIVGILGFAIYLIWLNAPGLLIKGFSGLFGG